MSKTKSIIQVKVKAQKCLTYQMPPKRVEIRKQKKQAQHFLSQLIIQNFQPKSNWNVSNKPLPDYI